MSKIAMKSKEDFKKVIDKKSISKYNVKYILIFSYNFSNLYSNHPKRDIKSIFNY